MSHGAAPVNESGLYGNLCGILSIVLFGKSSGTPTFFLANLLKFFLDLSGISSGVVSSILPVIFSGVVPSGISSDILSGMSSGATSGIYSVLSVWHFTLRIIKTIQRPEPSAAQGPPATTSVLAAFGRGQIFQKLSQKSFKHPRAWPLGFQNKSPKSCSKKNTASNVSLWVSKSTNLPRAAPKEHSISSASLGCVQKHKSPKSCRCPPKNNAIRPKKAFIQLCEGWRFVWQARVLPHCHTRKCRWMSWTLHVWKGASLMGLKFISNAGLRTPVKGKKEEKGKRRLTSTHHSAAGCCSA